ncbi:hypothetical protein [Novosphingobium colocasiae]|uniref:Tetratricopeptide repeat protein n=1 Tax=Novosphingobium colocasiae TaxID=1256513 RepID=A0A918PD83_9SPHN|nr:hypothetical protein [Novosphingobium colocasiae]GGY99466.1 hypothetical protein GCM10011614_12990 [Novosphingobium colocasiae]
MSLMLIAPLLLAQSSIFGGPVSQLPPEIIQKKEDEANKRALQTAERPSAPAQVGCTQAVDSDPAGAARFAREALAKAVGAERVRAGLCLGLALSATEQWDEAQAAFIDARNSAAEDDKATRARLGDMAANAALAQGKPEAALSILGPAAADAQAAQDQTLVAAVAIDRARAQVAQKQDLLASQALAEARAADPANAQAWLLSATLSRRMNHLDIAAQQIAQAAQLAPQDPEVGLEAGVIAMLAGREEPARRSWQSVVALAPESAAATTARGYLAQLGPAAPAAAKETTP